MSLQPDASRTPRLDAGTAEELRATIREYFNATWQADEGLFSVMAADEAFYRRADPLRHPLIFYLGHTATFFINKLILAKVLTERVEPRFESIFAIGVDEMSWDDLDSKHYDWPPVEDVRDYRQKVLAVVNRLIDEMPLTVPVGWESPFWVIMMGCEHARIHLETSSVINSHLPLDVVQPRPEWPVCGEAGPAPQNELLDVAAGRVLLGKDRDHGLYGWDNEYGRLEADIAGYRAARYLTSNGEFLDFVNDGGYDDRKWWTGEGWAWRTFQQAKHPRFWVGDEGEWKLRCMAQEIAMPWNWPAEVNQLEAKAFCTWLAARSGDAVRLPTEEEWYRLLDLSGIPDQPDWAAEPGNINLVEFASSCPVDRHVTAGFGDVTGNVWQHTETPITGFPGFEVHPFYDDFSTPTFDTKHNLIKGGSWISTGNEATRDSRYAFRRHFYQHAGFRYIVSEAPVTTRGDVYETDALVAQYCEFHYGDEYFSVPNFPKALADLCAELVAGRGTERALDLGCATGRGTFELARVFDHVTGIDFSARFIRVGHELQRRGSSLYAIPDEGELMSFREIHLADLELDGVRDKVEFRQGDAHNLKPQFIDYDLVLAANLVDRLYEPKQWLDKVHERMRPGGLLVITSPYTWLEEFTPKDKWLGGIKVDGENVTTLDGLHTVLAPHFSPVGEPRDIEFVIRETVRKHQHTVAQVTVWERKA